jgi:DNA polymerase III epsilon subunit-like protein
MKSVYFDIETSGLTDAHPEIELAAVAIDEKTWVELAVFEAKLQFDEKLADPEALKLNHYDRAIWKREAVPVAEAAVRFSLFLQPFRCIQMVSKRTGNPYSVAKLVSHNAAFDAPRLKRMFQAQFLAADPRVRCTLQRALWWFDERGVEPANYQLATLAKYFGIPVPEGVHGALADARLAVAVSRAMSINGGYKTIAPLWDNSC